MRLDKFLKISGLIPRRTVAKEACDAGRVSVNGRPAKSSATVTVGDRIVIDLGRGRQEVDVTEVPQGGVSRNARSRLYRVVDAPESGGTARDLPEGSS